jgi:glycosyltransferase involved in cell wall biosynthesis
MRVAFYAPLKPPDHPVPSGDRRVARLLIAALESRGHEVVLASRLRSRDPTGTRLARFAALAPRLAARVVRRLKPNPPAAWLTYHLYDKAPDWIGPAVSRAFGIPYLVAEASVAPSRAEGPRAIGHRAVLDALAQARAVLALSRRDMECLAPSLPDASRLIHFPPFLDAAPFAAAPRRTNDPPRLLAIGMMRPGAKRDSYHLLSQALIRLTDRAWTLDIVGDGPARAEIEADFAPLADRIRFLGAAEPAALPALCASADLAVWPAVDEAFGMALIEAQAAGTPVVAGGYGGVPEVIADGATGLVTRPGDVAGFAAAVAALLDDPAGRETMGRAARAHVRAHHDLPAAASRLDAIMREAIRR